MATNLADLLRMLVQAKKSGMLTIRDGSHEGAVALENGMIVNAGTWPYTGMHALFQLVAWREARFEFREQPLAGDYPRDLAVYDPEVLIAGVAAKMEEGGEVPGDKVGPLAR